MPTKKITDAIDPSAVLLDTDGRASKRRDSWPLQWVRDSRGELDLSPDAVVLPSTIDDVAAVVSWANETSTPVIIRGAGSGVCGGAMPVEGCVVLETTRLDKIVNIDTVSMVVEVEAGVNGDVLEAALNQAGLTLGHYPQSMGISTVGGWLATSSAGQASPGFGFIEDRVVGLEAVLGDGTIVRIPPSARSAVGPDLRRLFIGAEGRFAVVTKVFLACAPKWHDITWLAFRFDTFEQTIDFARKVHYSGAQPTFLRGWDEVDTTAAFDSIETQTGCVSVVGFVDSLAGIDGRTEAVQKAAESLGAVVIDPAYGQTWWDGRLHAVEVFGEVLGAERSWGKDLILDTSEVSTLWRDASTAHREVMAAVADHVEWIRCHYSHVFDVGIALYFTFVVRGADVAEMEDRYHDVWNRIMTAAAGSGAALSHHHGMGRLKAGYTNAAIGPGASRVLRGLLNDLDPNSVLNPGVLVPHEAG